MMRYCLCMFLFIGLTAFAPVSAEEDIVSLPDMGLVIATTPTPVTAADTRDDGILRDETGRPVTHELLGQPLFQFEAPFVDGGTFNSDSLRGKWTVMVFWGIWCHDSRNDAQNISAVAKYFANHQAVQFMSLHVPYNRDYLDKRFGDYDSVEAYFTDAGVSWPTALDEESILRNWQKIRWTPTYLVIGPDMIVMAYRTDLSVAGEGAVERFMDEVEALVLAVAD